MPSEHDYEHVDDDTSDLWGRFDYLDDPYTLAERRGYVGANH